jgi:hypothetical protein
MDSSKNENFDKPQTWDEIVEHCTKALVSLRFNFGVHPSKGIVAILTAV